MPDSVSCYFTQTNRQRDHIPHNTRMGGLLSPHPYTSFSTLCLCPLHAEEPDLVSQNKFIWHLEFRLPLYFEGLDYQTLKGIGKSNLLGLNLYSYYISVMNPFNTLAWSVFTGVSEEDVLLPGVRSWH